ncbi:MAG: PQQ-binding-like beta-propeller repeat protein [Acidobacteria bacterium]|nr:PQQ-binding-like beta-propeller repeat protein [Acidobacteriota bacterium]
MKKLLILLAFVTAWSTVAAQTGKYPLQVGDDDRISLTGWSPRGDLLVTSAAGEQNLRLWDVKTGKVLWKKGTGFIYERAGDFRLETAAWSADQKYILTGADEGKIQLWEAATGRLVWNVRAHAEAPTMLAVSPNGRVFASLSETRDLNTELKIWNLADGRLLADLSADSQGVAAVAFIDDARFATGDAWGRVTVRSVDGFKELATAVNPPCGRPDRRRTSIVYSADFHYYYAFCGNGYELFDVRAKSVVRRFPEDRFVNDASFSADGKKLLLGGNTLKSWIVDLATGRIRILPLMGGELNPDGTLVADADLIDDGVQIYDTATGAQKYWLVGHPGVVKALAFSRDGGRFAAGGGDRLVRVWETATKRLGLTLEGHTDDVEAVEFSADGRRLTSKSAKETIVWNADTGAMIGKTRVENRFSEDARSLSPDGKYKLVKPYEKPFRLVDAKTDATIREFVYIDQLDNFAFTPDARYFLVKPWWQGWQLWSVEKGGPLREFDVGYSYDNVVAFHPDGRTFITGGGGQNILMFDLETGALLWSIFPIDRDYFEQQRRSEALRVELIERKKQYAARADADNRERVKSVTAAFSHYGDAESFWNRKLAESGATDKSKLKLPKDKAKFAWFTLANASDLPVSIDTNGMILNSKCKGLCDGADIDARYVMEFPDQTVRVNGIDVFAKTLLPPRTTVYFSVALEHLNSAEAIYLGFTFQKENPDDKDSRDYGTEQKLYLNKSDLP